MATVLESLVSISGYPIGKGTIIDIATKRGLNLDDEATIVLFQSPEYRLATADLMRWVSYAPNVRQADVQYDLLYSDREQLRKAANAIYGELGDDAYIPPETVTKYGYKGSRI
jgi:hypothetical protein